MTTIFAFTGKRFSGKDTAAKALINIGFKQMSFADPLREILVISYGLTMEEMTDPVLKETVLDRFPFRTPRDLMTEIGTRGFRDTIHDDTWVQALGRRLNDESHVVITDLRFLNEEKMLREHGALIIRVVNPNVEHTDDISQHRSETEMDQVVPDITILNDGTIEDLHEKVLSIRRGYTSDEESICNHYEALTQRY